MERNNNIDFMKFFAIFFVVCIHTTPFKDTEQLSNFINVFARFAVPFFFMSSGYLFGQKLRIVYNPYDYVKRNSIKNFKLYVAWIAVYFFYDLFLKIVWAVTGGVNVKQAIIEYFKLFFNIKIFYYGTDTGSSHLWFIIALLWSIMIVYSFDKIKKTTALLIASFVLSIVGVFGQSYSVFLEIPVYTRDALFFGLFYTTLGYWFSSNQHKFKISPAKWTYLLIATCIIQIIEANFLINEHHARLGNYYLSTIPLAFFLFAIVLKSKNQISPSSIFVRIGSQAVGIYVIHPIFISITAIMVKLLRLEDMASGLIWNVLFTPVIFCISYLSYWMIQLVKSKLLSMSNKGNSNIEKSKLISQ